MKTKELTIELTSIADAARQLGINYHKMWYTVNAARVVTPVRIGRVSLLTNDDVKKIAEHLNVFSTIDKGGKQ